MGQRKHAMEIGIVFHEPMSHGGQLLFGELPVPSVR